MTRLKLATRNFLVFCILFSILGVADPLIGPGALAARSHEKFRENGWRDMTDRAGEAMREGRDSEALAGYKDAVAEAEKVKAEDDLLARSYENLGRFYKRRRDFENACLYFTRALERRRETLTETAEPVARSLEDIIYCLFDQRRYEALGPRIDELLALREKQYGAQSPELIRPLELETRLYRDRRDYDRCQQYLERLQSITAKAYGGKSVEAAECLRDLARNRRDQRRYADAAELYEKALAVQEKAMPSESGGKNHPDIARTLDEIADCYRHEERYDRAIDALSRSLAIKEKLYGEEHLEVARALGDLADCRANSHQEKEARADYEKQLTILRKVLGENHMDCAHALDRLANLERQCEDLPAAIEAATSSLNVREKLLGKKSLETARHIRWVAGMYSQKGELEKAETMLSEEQDRLARGSREYLNVLRDRRHLLQRLKKDKEAEALDKKIKSMEK